MPEEVKEEQIEEEIPDDTPDSNFSKIDNGMFYLPVLEVYKNDYDNYEPYIPKSGGTDNKNKDEEKEKEQETDEEQTEEEEQDDSKETEEKPFNWMLGEVLETYYYNRFSSIDYEFDYAEIESSSSIQIPTQIDLLRFYKGVQCKIFCGYFKLNQQIEMEDIPLVNALFIEDLTFKEEGTDLSLKGGDILLDEKYEFNFTQMKRSEILKEMIKTAGLEAAVDPTGLIDDVIDYSNVKSSGGSGSDSDSKDLNQLVKNAIKGKSGKREKAEAIHNALRDSCIKYRKYNDFQYNTVKECFDHRQDPGLNCGDTSQLTVGAMKIGGLSAETLLTDDSAHYITRIEGQWFSDLVWSEGQCSQRPFNETWNNYRGGTPHKAPGN